ncbi:ABC transporter ATP-binding protein [Microbacterium sp. H37-C3]|uniref:ATP-binding cassette domain-containing protein n=1 Tax=Microbacterium sp. H37-C3 TaxID=3004354 RepID=UPI0022AEEB17|nr:ABC transporter ATP-binding protein [Microbacterium sp. H37-C3]MCZ4066908.1 ABC transporter ATP-binding protein [Microbacterium sp. H37-C3]
MNNVVEVRDVSVTLGGIDLYRGATLNLRRGATVALTGPNGSGKSVLLKVICGFVTPDSGSVWIDPSLLSSRRTFPERFGIAIDGPAYIPGRTGLQNLLELARIRRQITVEDVRAAMMRVGLDPDAKQKVRNYSLGMKQKLSLAQALMEKPEVLLLDEPFNALDKSSVERVTEILRAERERGTTILFTSHSERDVHTLADEVFRVEEQRLVAH